MIVLFVTLFSLASRHALAAPQVLEKQTTAKITQIRKDPLGDQDSFLSLSSKEQSEWGFDLGQSLDQSRDALRNLQTQLVVDIRLVGFDGEGMEGVVLPSTDVAWHLQSLSPVLEAVTLQYLSEDTWIKKSLGVRTKLLYQVSKVGSDVSHQVQTAISTALDAEMNQGHGQADEMATISYEPVDEVIKAHNKRTGTLHTIYILNPPRQAMSYAYSYKSREFCSGTIWAASSERYVWIDLTAGPLTYGSIEAGQGRVLPHSFPRVEHYKEELRNKALAPDIAALINSGTKHLLVPGSVNLYQKDWTTLRIQIVHVHDAMNPSKVIKEVGEYDHMTSELQHLTLVGQNVLVEHFYVGFGHCDVCVAAYSRALQTRTERIPGAGVHIVSTSYLDSAKLYAWLSDDNFLRRLTDNQGKSILMYARPPKRIIPVFIFELTSLESLTLDGRKNVVSFPDMVLAVRTYGGSGSSGYSCMEKKVPLQSAKIFRPILAAILQTGWGVMDTSESIGQGERGIQKDSMWSVGNTVFGPLAGTYGFSFSQRDVARRNTVLAKIHSVATQADTILRGFQNVSATGFVFDTLPADKIPTFFQRMNMLMFKLNKATLQLGTLRYDDAWYFARSARQEVLALHDLAEISAGSVSSVLECQKKKGDLKLWLLGLLGIGVGLVLWILRKLGPRKKKRY
ncbi:hypothetical protein BSKO_07231 [Bryopsis sp. KO-2023]|nr:hypothetical protein BSKO_07231 [Bryopsis sp. KO-2023]